MSKLSCLIRFFHGLHSKCRTTPKSQPQTLSLKTWPAACRCTTPALVQLSLIYPWAVNATISTDSRNLLVFKLKRTDLSLLSNLLCVSTFNQFIDIWIHQSNPFRHVSYIRTRCGSFYFEECLWIIEQCSSLGTLFLPFVVNNVRDARCPFSCFCGWIQQRRKKKTKLIDADNPDMSIKAKILCCIFSLPYYKTT